MATENQSTLKLNADISGLKKGISDANRQIKLANSAFKSAISSMDDWSTSTDGLTKKIGQLESVYDSENKKLELLRKQYELTADALGENSKEAENLQIRINNQEAVVNKTAKEISNYREQLQQIGNAAEQAGNGAEHSASSYQKLTDKISEQETQLAKLKDDYKEYVLNSDEASDEAKELANEISDLSKELKENKDKLKNADKAADELADSLDDVGDSGENSSGGIGALTIALGNLVAEGIQMAISAVKDFVKEVVNVGKEFDSSMSQVSAISGATADELEKLRDKAKQMGSTTKFTASEAADAFNYMAMAGWDTEQMLDGIDGVLNLAAASGSDLATTSDIVTDALTAMGYSAAEAGHLADVMAVASSNANTNVEMMGGTFKYVAPVAGALGYTMEDVAVAIGLMANSGIKAEQAGTSLRSMLSRLAAPPKECATAMDELGISLTDSEGNMKSLDQVMIDLREAFDGLSETEQTAAAKHIAGQEAMTGLLAIVNAAPEDFDKLTEAVANSEGAAEEMAKTMLDNLGGDMTILQSQLEGVQLAVYEKFEPAMRSGVEVLSKLLDALSFVIDHSNEVVGAITAIATAIGTYLAYTTAMKVMTEGWQALTIVTKAQTVAQAALNAVMSLNPIGLVIAAIAALVAAFIYFWNTSEDFRNFWIGLWEEIQKTVTKYIDAIVTFFSNIWEGIKSAFAAFVDWFKKNWKTLLLFITNPVAGVIKYLYDNFEGVRNFINGVWSSISEAASKVWEAIKEFFAPAVEWFSELFNSIWESFKSIINVIVGLAKGTWEIIKRVYEVVSQWFNTNVIQPVAKFFADLWNKISTLAKEAWDKISTAAKKAWDFISGVWKVVSGWFNINIIKPISNFFSGMWEGLKKGASDAWDGIKSVFSVVTDWFKEKFSAAWQAVKDVFSTGGKIFAGIKDGIVNAFKTIVNAIIRGINKVISIPFDKINGMLNTIRNVDILGLRPFEDLWGENPLKVPQIPELAKGGVLRKGQVGLLEGDGAEAVVPLEKNTQWIKRIAGELKQELGGMSSEAVTNYNFYQTNNSPKALSRLDIYRQTKNQIAMLKGV